MSDRDAHIHHRLYGCYLKLERAQTHFDALKNAIEEFRGGQPYEIVHNFEPESGHYVAWFEIRERPSPAWSPIIGDIVHNTRSALDHLAWQLVIRNGRNPVSARPQFPIFTRDSFDPSVHDSLKDAKRARVSWKSQTRGMHKGDVEFLKGLQPYNGPSNPGDHPLAQLNQLSNWDKHREFHFASQAFMGYIFSVKETTRNALVRPLYFKPKGTMLEDGEIIARFDPFAVGPNPKLHMDLKVIFEVAFGERSPLEGLGIKQTLSAIGLYVSNIILEFNERFDKQDFSPPSGIPM